MRTKLFKNAFWVIALAIVVCGFPMQSSAASFTFTEKAGFMVGGTWLGSSDASTPYDDIKWYQNSTNADYQVAPLAGEYNTIAWGRSNNAGGELTSDPWDATGSITQIYSSLRIFGQTGAVESTMPNDPGGWVILTKLFHKNSSIAAAYFDLTNASINGNLTIAPADNGFPDDKISNIMFLETFNQSPCDPAGPGGEACPDYFIDVISTFAPLFFTSGAGQYTVLFDLVPVSYAQIDFPASDQVRVWTEEGQISQVNVMMKIVQVPEPASLLLLGLGLLGLGFIKRRKG